MNPFFVQQENPNDFLNFMNRMQGQNPQQIIDGLVRSGKLSQAQLNTVQQKAKQYAGLFEPFKKMLGFK